MWQLDSIGQTDLADLRYYPGLIGALVHRPSQKKFAEKVRNAYPELHSESGRALLLFAGFSNWVPESDIKRMRSDVRRTINRDEFSTEFIVSLRSSDRFDASERLLDLQSRFGLKTKQLPCLILLEQVDDASGYVFEFDETRISSTNDMLESDFGSLFDIFQEEVSKKPFIDYAHHIPTAKADPKQVTEWRRETLIRVLPALRRLKCFNFLKSNGGALASGIVGLSGLLPTKF